MTSVMHKWLICAWVVIATPLATHASVYSNLMSEFSMHPHRLPGSENFDRSFDALKGELEKAGLEPKVQTYDTLVPRTKHCRLKLGNQLIEPVHGGFVPGGMNQDIRLFGHGGGPF